MAKAYICDRCGEPETGTAEARVFLESHALKNQGCRPGGAGVHGSATLAKCEDLCRACTNEITACIEKRPIRHEGP